MVSRNNLNSIKNCVQDSRREGINVVLEMREFRKHDIQNETTRAYFPM